MDESQGLAALAFFDSERGHSGETRRVRHKWTTHVRQRFGLHKPRGLAPDDPYMSVGGFFAEEWSNDSRDASDLHFDHVMNGLAG